MYTRESTLTFKIASNIPYNLFSTFEQLHKIQTHMQMLKVNVITFVYAIDQYKVKAAT